MNSPPVLTHYTKDETNAERVKPFLHEPMLVDTNDTLDDFIKYITEWRILFKEQLARFHAEEKNVIKFPNF
jgi:hypothetical protein